MKLLLLFIRKLPLNSLLAKLDPKSKDSHTQEIVSSDCLEDVHRVYRLALLSTPPFGGDPRILLYYKGLPVINLHINCAWEFTLKSL